jgi:Ca2+-binding RTX toxin-like protein
VLAGGSGDDREIGGFGNDTLYAGPGADLLFAGPGRDVLFARAPDNQVDIVHCGRGYDVAYIRAEDVADASCERVVRVASTETDPGDEDTPPAAVAPPGGNDGAGR